MTLRLCGTISLIMLASVVLCPRAAADEPKFEDVDPKGKPDGFKAGQSARFAIWYDDGTWHFRTTTAKDSKKFSGTIDVVGGKMVSLNPLTVEKGGKGKKKDNLDFGSWNPEGTQFTFSFTTGHGMDGFDMKLSDKSTALKFALKIEGKEMPDHIFIGSKNAHPKGATFFLPAQSGR